MQTPTPRDLPVVVRLLHSAVCGCGEHLASGERVGYLSAHEGVACLRCMADHQAGRLHLVELLAQTRSLSGPAAAADGEAHAETDVEADLERRRAAAAHRHRVGASADELLHRLLAIRALGTLRGEPQGLEVLTAERA